MKRRKKESIRSFDQRIHGIECRDQLLVIPWYSLMCQCGLIDFYLAPWLSWTVKFPFFSFLFSLHFKRHPRMATNPPETFWNGQEPERVALQDCSADALLNDYFSDHRHTGLFSDFSFSIDESIRHSIRMVHIFIHLLHFTWDSITPFAMHTQRPDCIVRLMH